MLSRNLFTSRGDDLGAFFVPDRNGIDRTRVARAQQSLALDGFRIHEYRGAGIIEDEGLRRFGDAVAEADAQGAVDPDTELPDTAFFEVAHIPSSPSSARAVSMTAGVISVMPRSFA